MRRGLIGLLSTGFIASFAFSPLVGCTPRAQVNSPSGSVATGTLALYQEAKQHFSTHDYAGALTRLDTIVASPSLTTQQRAYYQRQQQICREALGGKKAPAVGTVAPRPRPTAQTVTASSADCGPRALLLVCEELHVANPPTIQDLRTLAGTRGDGTNLSGLEHAAEKAGLAASGVQMDKAALDSLDKPAIAWVDGNHYIAVLNVRTSLAGVTTATVHDPNEGKEKQMEIDELLRRSGGVLLVLSKASTNAATKVAARN